MSRGVVFVVGDEPYGVWDLDIRDRNLLFLNNVDADYFHYLAKVHGEQLENDPQRAAIALRTAYHYGLESFFALLFATIQAPACVFAWLRRYKTAQLRQLVGFVNAGQMIRNKLGLSEPTWEAISDRINGFNQEPAALKESRQLFADLWRGFAYDFLDRNHANEYNSIKHGLRQRSGGFGLAVGLETDGQPAPPERMSSIGGSEFGSSYFELESIPSTDKSSRHFRVRRHALNWSPDAMFAALQLIAVSINNVVSRTKIINGIPGKDVKFQRPEDPAFFEEPWREIAGVTHMTLDVVIREEGAHLLSKEELLAIYDGSAKS